MMEEEVTIPDLTFSITSKKMNKASDALKLAVKGRLDRLFKTICLCGAHLSLGVGLAIIGPLLPDLSTQIGVDMDKIMQAFASRGIGYVVGATAGGYLSESRNLSCHVAFALILLAIGLAIVPWCRNLTVLAAVFTLQGLSAGAIQTGCEVMSRQTGRGIQAHHVSFGVGAFITPLIVQPFTVDNSIVPTAAIDHLARLPVNATIQYSTLPVQMGVPELPSSDSSSNDRQSSLTSDNFGRHRRSVDFEATKNPTNDLNNTADSNRTMTDTLVVETSKRLNGTANLMPVVSDKNFNKSVEEHFFNLTVLSNTEAELLLLNVSLKLSHNLSELVSLSEISPSKLASIPTNTSNVLANGSELKSSLSTTETSNDAQTSTPSQIVVTTSSLPAAVPRPKKPSAAGTHLNRDHEIADGSKYSSKIRESVKKEIEQLDPVQPYPEAVSTRLVIVPSTPQVPPSTVLSQSQITNSSSISSDDENTMSVDNTTNPELFEAVVTEIVSSVSVSKPPRTDNPALSGVHSGTANSSSSTTVGSASTTASSISTITSSISTSFSGISTTFGTTPTSVVNSDAFDDSGHALAVTTLLPSTPVTPDLLIPSVRPSTSPVATSNNNSQLNNIKNVSDSNLVEGITPPSIIQREPSTLLSTSLIITSVVTVNATLAVFPSISPLSNDIPVDDSIDSQGSSVELNRGLKIQLVYWAVAAVVALVSVGFAFCWGLCELHVSGATRSSSEDGLLSSEEAEVLNGASSTAAGGEFRVIIFLSVLALHMLYAGAETTFSTLVTSFAITEQQRSWSMAVTLCTAFWGMFTLGRLVGSFLPCISPASAIFAGLFLGCCSLAAMVVAFDSVTPLIAHYNRYILLVGSSLLGLGMSAVLPAISAWLEKSAIQFRHLATAVILGMGLGQALLPLLAGYVFVAKSPIWMMYMMLTAVILSIIVYVALRNLLMRAGPDRYILAPTTRVTEGDMTDVPPDSEQDDLEEIATDTNEEVELLGKIASRGLTAGQHRSPSNVGRACVQSSPQSAMQSLIKNIGSIKRD